MKKILFLVLLLFSLTYCKKVPPVEPEGNDPTEQTDPEEPVVEPGQEPVDNTVHVSEVTIGPEEAIALEPGKTAQLTCTVLPEDAEDKTITWTSSDKEVATVDDKGLVTAVSVGEALISVTSKDGNKVASKDISVFQATADAFTAIRITSHPSHDQKIYLRPGGTITVTATAEPANADDQLEFVQTGQAPSYYITDISPTVNGVATATLIPIANYGQFNGFIPVQFYVRSKKNKNVQSTRRYVVVASSGDSSTSGYYAKNLYLSSTASDYGFIHPRPSHPGHSKYIGKGATQRFIFYIWMDTYNVSNSKGCLSLYPLTEALEIVDHTGQVEFSLSERTVIDDKACITLTAKAPAKATVSSSTSEVISTVTIGLKGPDQEGGYRQTFSFTLSELDPYVPKPGDFLGGGSTGPAFIDGGNRGNGIREFKRPYYENGSTDEGYYPYHYCADYPSIIAWIGKDHLQQDQVYRNDYCYGGLVAADGTVLHGIAIPTFTTHLYRKTKPNGEVFSDEWDNLVSSDAWPKWFKDHYLSYIYMDYSRMTAFTNTCALVYRNRYCGTSHDVKPANFFVENELLAPSLAEKPDLTTSSFSWESDFYGCMITGNLKNPKDDPFSDKAPYNPTTSPLSPWLFPTAKDLFMVFYDQYPGIDATKTYSFSSKINILRTSLYIFHGVDASIPNYNYSYWTSQQAMNDTYSKAVGFVISGAQGGIKYLNKPSDRAYVLPIAYF